MDLIEARALDAASQPSRHPWELARLDIVTHLLQSRQVLASGGVVADIGCGDTFVAESLSRRFPGTEFVAVDTAFDEAALRHYRAATAGSRVSVYARCEDAPAAQLRHVQLVLLMDVIEHVPDDVALLRGLVADQVIGPQTTVLITVPAFQALFSSHDVQLRHYRRYSRRSLHDSVHRAGLRVRDSGYFFSALVPVRVAQLAVEKLSPKPADGAAPGLAGWHGSETMSRVLSGAMYADARIGLGLQRLGIPVPGLSAYAICERTAGA